MSIESIIKEKAMAFDTEINDNGREVLKTSEDKDGKKYYHIGETAIPQAQVLTYKELVGYDKYGKAIHKVHRFDADTLTDSEAETVKTAGTTQRTRVALSVLLDCSQRVKALSKDKHLTDDVRQKAANFIAETAQEMIDILNNNVKAHKAMPF